MPDDNVARVADFLLLHGNGTAESDLIAEQVDRTRSLAAYRGQPILFNEDDHFDFQAPWNNCLAAVSRHASWGFFDAGPAVIGSGASGNYRDGYQLVPVNWQINTPRKQQFFQLVATVTACS